jgi:glycosyltransferase involved in cell wall biosynthesis
LKILLVEPYYTGSHAAWAEGYARHSRHQIDILSLPGRFWKWRMHGGAVTLARKFHFSDLSPDLILATDMLDLATFLALTRPDSATLPTAIYFHENQLTYPWSPADRDIAQKRDKQYGFINYTSALAADVVLFNSSYHAESFLMALPQLLKHFPDYNELSTVDYIIQKSRVLPLGLDLRRLDQFRPTESGQKDRELARPLVLWNHRWEYDKGPEEFFEALGILSERGLDFDLAVLGENYSRQPEVFLAAEKRLTRHIVQFGYVDSLADYTRWLWRADIVPVTSHQDFFGASVVEAIYCDSFPLLPKRLAYPDLIPPEYQPRCFYDDFDDLLARLTEAITNIEQTRRLTLRPIVSQYDWQHQAKQYDELLAALAGS